MLDKKEAQFQINRLNGLLADSEAREAALKKQVHDLRMLVWDLNERIAPFISK